LRTKILEWIRRAVGTERISVRLERIERELHIGAVDTASSNYEGVKLAILSASTESFIRCELNGSIAWLPTDTIRTMIHCLRVVENKIVLDVEVYHIKWMIDRLKEPSGEKFFLDVGAATGAATIPIAMQIGSELSITAFEPARNAMRLLLATLEKNSINSVQLVHSAVSNQVGNAEFIEFAYDVSGNCPYISEASTISHQGIPPDLKSECYTVECITLDSFFNSNSALKLAPHKSMVVKIDVEGFEEHVLNGGIYLIKSVKPYFSIDIHKRIDGDGTTEGVCRDILSKFGYRFENMDHVLLASPK